MIKGARFKGKTMVHFLDMKDFKGNLIAAVDEVLDFIQRHISMGVGIGAKAARDEKWDYPLEALREAVVNAIVHRDYTDPGNIQIRIFDDRLEIWSPGLLPKELNIKNLLVGKPLHPAQQGTGENIPRHRFYRRLGDGISADGGGVRHKRQSQAGVQGNDRRFCREVYPASRQ